MAHEDFGMGIMDKVGYGESADFCPCFHMWKEGASRRNNIHKCLMNLSATGKITRRDGFFCLPHLRGNYDTHARSLTRSLVAILSKFPDSLVRREPVLVEAGLKPDALVLIRRENLGLCVWLEQTNTERESYFNGKMAKLQAWTGALTFLSATFGFKVPTFTVVRSMELDRFLESL